MKLEFNQLWQDDSFTITRFSFNRIEFFFSIFMLAIAHMRNISYTPPDHLSRTAPNIEMMKKLINQRIVDMNSVFLPEKHKLLEAFATIA